MSDPLSPMARALLDAADGGDDPSHADAARVRARLAVELGAVAGAAGAAATAAKITSVTSASAATGKAASAAGATSLGGGAAAGMTGLSAAATTGLSTKVLGVVALVVATSGAGIAVQRGVTSSESHAPAPRLVAPSSPAPPASARAAKTPPAAIATPDEAELATPDEPTDERPIAPSPPAPADVPSPAAPRVARGDRVAPAAPTPPTPPLAHDERARTGATTGTASSVSSSAASAVALADATSIHVVPSASPAANAGAPAPLDPLVEEAALLRSAKAALARGDGASALTTLGDHERRFPHGTLAPERQASRVLALCALGRASEARAAASSFLAANASSPLARGVERSCAVAEADRNVSRPRDDR